TALWSGDPAALTASPFGDNKLTFSVETLRVDNHNGPAGVDWKVEGDSVSAGGPLYLSTAGAGVTVIHAATGPSPPPPNMLTGRDANSAPQTVTIASPTDRYAVRSNVLTFDPALQGTVRMEEGADVLSPGAFLDPNAFSRTVLFEAPDAPHSTAVSPDGK